MQLVYVNPPTGYVAPVSFAGTEYPKYVHFPDKPSVIVQDAEEEAAVIAGETIPEPRPAAPIAHPAPIVSLVGANDEMTMLRKIAADKNIHLDGRWNVKKARVAVAVGVAAIRAAQG